MASTGRREAIRDVAHYDSSIRQGSRPDRRPHRRRAARPPVEPISIDSHVVSDYPDMDRVGHWIGCRPGCSDAAYLVNLHEGLEEARTSIDPRAEALARRLLNAHPADLTDGLPPLTFYVYRLVIDGLVGRDYRRHGCSLPDWQVQLHHGRGDEQAWDELRRQRHDDDVKGVLLPGETASGDLFMFALDVRAEITALDLVETVEWPG